MPRSTAVRPRAPRAAHRCIADAPSAQRYVQRLAVGDAAFRASHDAKLAQLARSNEVVAGAGGRAAPRSGAEGDDASAAREPSSDVVAETPRSSRKRRREASPTPELSGPRREQQGSGARSESTSSRSLSQSGEPRFSTGESRRSGSSSGARHGGSVLHTPSKASASTPPMSTGDAVSPPSVVVPASGAAPSSSGVVPPRPIDGAAEPTERRATAPPRVTFEVGAAAAVYHSLWQLSSAHRQHCHLSDVQRALSFESDGPSVDAAAMEKEVLPLLSNYDQVAKDALPKPSMSSERSSGTPYAASKLGGAAGAGLDRQAMRNSGGNSQGTTLQSDAGGGAAGAGADEGSGADNTDAAGARPERPSVGRRRWSTPPVKARPPLGFAIAELVDDVRGFLAARDGLLAVRAEYVLAARAARSVPRGAPGHGGELLRVTCEAVCVEARSRFAEARRPWTALMDKVATVLARHYEDIGDALAEASTAPTQPGASELVASRALLASVGGARAQPRPSAARGRAVACLLSATRGWSTVYRCLASVLCVLELS